MQVDTILVMIVTLIFGTFALSLLGSIGASITISINNSNILTSLIILPIAIPILIFGARTIVLYQTGISALSGFYFLSAYCMFALSFAPYASASAIKIGLD
jgi:heme exporter protein B